MQDSLHRAEERAGQSRFGTRFYLYLLGRMRQLSSKFRLSLQNGRMTGLLGGKQQPLTRYSALWGIPNMDKNTAKRANEEGNAAVAEQPDERSEEMTAEEARAAANRLLALLEPFEATVPRSDFIFIADCHDPKRHITPSRLAKLRIMVRTYANGLASRFLSRAGSSNVAQ
jgi:hypothetical protein